jgi:hypothetical protein
MRFQRLGYSCSASWILVLVLSEAVLVLSEAVLVLDNRHKV